MQGTTFRARSRVAVLSGVARPGAGGCVHAPAALDPAAVRGRSTPQQTRVAILRALSGGNWVLESEKPGEILARFSRSEWTMLVEIAYSNEVSIRYLSSMNLRYGIGRTAGTVIHRGYNNRVMRLSKEISKEIMIARATDSPPPDASPPPGEVVPD